MKKQKKNLLVTLADESYIEQAKQLFSSVYWNAGWKGDYMLLTPHDEIPEKQLKWFRDKGILVKKCKPLLKTKNQKFGRWPITVLSKFYLFTPEFKKWKNIVYLDVDIIVRGSLEKLTKVRGFAVCKDELIKTMFLKNSFKKIEGIKKQMLKNFKKIYNLEKRGFNSGMMAFNTEILKGDMLSKLDRLCKFYYPLCTLPDQAILNLFFYGRWIELPLIFNSRYHYTLFSTFCKKPNNNAIVIHFAGDIKPWFPQCLFFKEWKINLEKAELINIKKLQKPIKKYSEKEITKYSLILRAKEYLFLPIQMLDCGIGLIGLFLKKYHPKLYFKLKKLKDKNYDIEK